MAMTRCGYDLHVTLMSWPVIWGYLQGFSDLLLYGLPPLNLALDAHLGTGEMAYSVCIPCTHIRSWV